MNHVRNAAFTLVIWELDGWVTSRLLIMGTLVASLTLVTFSQDLFLNYVGPFCRIL